MATSTSTTQYPPWLEDMMKKVASETGRLYDAKAAPQFFPGDTVANFTPDQTQGQEMLRQLLTQQGPNSMAGGLNAAQSANTALLDPNVVWNLNATPGYAAAKEGIIQDAGRNLSENWMPSVRNDSISSGMYGGSRGQIGEALGAARSTEELTQGLANLDLNVFGNMLQAHQNAITRAPGVAQATMIPAQAMQNLGSTVQNQNQAEITGARERWSYDQNKPWWLLDQLRTSAGNVQGGQTTTSSSKESDPNIWQTIGGLLSTWAGSQNSGNAGGSTQTPPYVPPQNFNYFGP